MSHPLVYVIVLNWNGLQDTLECLESVYRNDYQYFRVILVDNHSDDPPADAVRSAHPRTLIIENKRNLGFTGGNNQAMRLAMANGADYLWLLNNDTVVNPDALGKMVETLEKSPDAGMASPLIRYYDSADLQFCGSRIDWGRSEIVLFEDYDAEEQQAHREAISLWGTALLIRRGLVEKIGYLNEKYFAYFEDEEYSLRANEAGFRNVIVPEALIYHKNSRSTGSSTSPVQTFLRTRNCYYLWMDRLRGLKRLHYFRNYLAYAIGYASNLKKAHLDRSVDACLAGVWAAFRGKGGSWDENFRMPAPWRYLFLLFISWVPYLWVCLLKGDFKYIRSRLMDGPVEGAGHKTV